MEKKTGEQQKSTQRPLTLLQLSEKNHIKDDAVFFFARCCEGSIGNFSRGLVKLGFRSFSIFPGSEKKG